MDFSHVLVALATIAVIAVLIIGGKATIGPTGVEISTEGVLSALRKAAEAKKQTLTDEAALRSQIQGLNRSRARLPVASVLWVDDHPLSNQRERLAMAEAGMFVDAYATNADGLEALRRQPYDMLISDITRDETTETGWDLLDAARKTRPELPLMVYAGYVDEERKAKASAHGAAITDSPGTLFQWALSQAR